MEETPATQYIFAPGFGVYHLPKSDTLSLCGIHVLGTEGKRRRRNDYRLVNEKPEGFTMLCTECQRIAAGAPKQDVDWSLFHSRRLRDIMP